MISLNQQLLWQHIISEATEASEQQPELSSFFHSHLLKHDSLAGALAYSIATKLESQHVSAMVVHELVLMAFNAQPELVDVVAEDIQAFYQRDAACEQYMSPLLYFKGFHALECYRLAHYLWNNDKSLMAYYVQSQIAHLFDVDIHPGATLGKGILIDHATGVVIGETCVIEDNVSMLHGVTLGGSGCGQHSGQRHPYIESGVLIAAGAKLLGCIRIGCNTKIGAGSVVLEDMPAQATVVGVPAKVVGKSLGAPSASMRHTS